MSSDIFIVLAAFNGAAFLTEQLESLTDQTVSTWILLIRDGGSTDSTLEIVADFCGRDDRIQLVESGNQGTGSALGNFSELLGVAFERGAEYVFCCDQDDVWEPHKLAMMKARLSQLEGETKVPSLVHHDLAVVNEFLEPVEDSFIRMMQLQPSDQHNPQRLISRNEVTGCALACNRALLEVALPISTRAVMHDWWLAMCAGFFGRLSFTPECLVKYRQHGSNTIGAKSFWHGLNPFTNWLSGWRRGNQEFVSTVQQARAFQQAMGRRLGRESGAHRRLEMFAGLLTATRLQRLQSLGQCNLWRRHWLLNIVLVVRIFLLPRTQV